jgi:hypothetical protein
MKKLLSMKKNTVKREDGVREEEEREREMGQGNAAAEDRT